MLMTHSERQRLIAMLFRFAVALSFAVTMLASQTAEAQTFTVLHRFMGPEGSSPVAGLTMDRAGNLYGTAMVGGDTQGYCYQNGCGSVFKLARRNSSWVYSVLY